MVLKFLYLQTFLKYNSLLVAATEIQNIQIGTGNVMRNVPIPIHMVFPRLFTCPTLSTPNFKLGTFVSVSHSLNNIN